MMAHTGQERLKQPSSTAWFWGWLRPQFRLRTGVRAHGLLPLQLSTALAEVAGNMVYVALLEKAYELGGETASVGWVLMVQAVPQVLLGTWAGSLVDRLGKRRAAILATLASAVLAVGLALAHTIVGVYVLAFLIMLARLVLIPARLALVSHLSSKTKLVAANTALTVLTGLGLFIGPAIGAVLALLTDGYNVPLMVAGLGLLFSMLPLLLVAAPPSRGLARKRASMWWEMRTGWQFIRKHSPIWKVLMCLVNVTMIFGVVTPLLTPLARHIGLGAEGTGVLMSAMGLGGLLGPWLATWAFHRLKLSTALLLSGLLAPAGLIWVGLIDRPQSVFAAITLTALAGASMNVIVTTILQRLTPSDRQGYVLGAEQALLGIAWIASLAATTGGASVWLKEGDPQTMLLIFGGFGFLSLLICWFWNRRPVQNICEMCEPRFRLSSIACWMFHGAGLPMSRVACCALCGKQCRGCYGEGSSSE